VVEFAFCTRGPFFSEDNASSPVTALGQLSGGSGKRHLHRLGAADGNGGTKGRNEESQDIQSAGFLPVDASARPARWRPIDTGGTAGGDVMSDSIAGLLVA